MKALKCELCGGTDILKDGEFFRCQSCGTKYTIEQARAIIEGVVNVEGTVKINNSDNIKQYLANARRAMKKEDWEETEKYYNLVEQYQPDNIEAIFYSSFGKAKQSLFVDDMPMRGQCFRVLTNSVSILDDNYNKDNQDNEEIISKISNDIMNMYNSIYTYKETISNNPTMGLIVLDNKGETKALFELLQSGFIDSIINIIQKDDRDLWWDILELHCKQLYANCRNAQIKTNCLDWIKKKKVRDVEKDNKDYSSVRDYCFKQYITVKREIDNKKVELNNLFRTGMQYEIDDAINELNNHIEVQEKLKNEYNSFVGRYNVDSPINDKIEYVNLNNYIITNPFGIVTIIISSIGLLLSFLALLPGGLCLMMMNGLLFTGPAIAMTLYNKNKIKRCEDAKKFTIASMVINIIAIIVYICGFLLSTYVYSSMQIS